MTNCKSDMNEDFCFDGCRPDPRSPLLGWICSYTPEELILAAGFIPYRIHSAAGGAGPDAYLPANLCPYVKSLLGVGLNMRRRFAGDGFCLFLRCDAALSGHLVRLFRNSHALSS